MCAYGIIRIQKCKSSQVGSMQYHNDREPGSHSNQDIDPARSHLNRELVRHGEYESEIQARIDAGYAGSRKIRKDAVRLVEGIVTASPEWFEIASKKDVDRFFNLSKAFVEKEFGKSNLIHFTIHQDETTIHAHFGVVPLRNGKLSFKEFFAGKNDLSKFQDRFYESVTKEFGLERGAKRDEREPVTRHRTVEDYKAEVARLEKKVSQTETRLESLQAEAVAVEEDCSQLETRAAALARERIVARSREQAAREKNQNLKATVSHLKTVLARALREVAGFAERIGIGGRAGFAWLERFGAKADEPEPIGEFEFGVGLEALEASARAASEAGDGGEARRGRSWQR